MKTIVAIAALCSAFPAFVVQAQTYRMAVRVPATYFRQPCAGPCACVHMGWSSPLTGTFDVRLTNIGDVFNMWAIENVNLAGSENGTPVSLTGSGTYRESVFVQQQQLSLDLLSNTGTSYSIDTAILQVVHPLPYFGAQATSTPTVCSQISLGLIAAPICPADLDDGTGSGSPDDAVDIQDLTYFLGAFANGAARADIDDGQSSGLPDGSVSIDDLLYMLARFEGGC